MKCLETTSVDGEGSSPDTDRILLTPDLQHKSCHCSSGLDVHFWGAVSECKIRLSSFLAFSFTLLLLFQTNVRKSHLFQIQPH